MRTIRQALILVTLLATVTIPAFGASARASRLHTVTGAGGSLTVFAAASLKEAFTTIGKQFGSHNGATVSFDFGGSDALVTQIAQGAPADVFVSANMLQMSIAQSKGLIASTPVVFVRNRLVVIVPRSNPGHIYSLPDLGRPGVRLVLAAPTVPVGKYARTAFAIMDHDAAFGTGFLGRINANIVSNELDVKAVAAKVVLGEADAGVIYVTDITSKVAPHVLRIDIPAPYNQIAKYPIAVVKGSQNAALAQKFVAYVTSPAGLAVLRRSGFITSAPAGGFAPSISLGGLVVKPMMLSVADLRTMPTTTVTATLRTDTKILGADTYTGVLLNNVVQAAVPLTNTSFKNDILRMCVTVGATDGYQIGVSMAEILPRFGNQPVLLAYEKDGQMLSKQDGAVELIVPGDVLAGRDVRNVDSIVVGTPFSTP